jgi:hypothetical protein
MFNPTVDVDGWEVDSTCRVIRLDQQPLLSSYSDSDHAEHLKHAIKTEFLGTRASLLSRVGWGTGKVVLGTLDREVGRTVGRGVFVVSSIAAGGLASIRILRVPGKVAVGFRVGGQPGGVQMGRLDALYNSSRAKDGMTILSINNNAGQSILRFVTHNGQLVVNGRIVGVQRVLSHETNARVILKGLLKLLVHGAKS